MVQQNSYLAKLRARLNPIERIGDLVGSTDDRLDIIAEMLFKQLELMAQQQPVIIDGGNYPQLPAQFAVNIPLDIQTVELFKDFQTLTTDAQLSQVMADCRKAIRALIVVNNGLDQQISIQVIGNNTNSNNAAFDIGSPINCPAGEKRAYGVKFEEWMPYVGLEFTPAGNPTLGAVNATVILQVQVK